MMKLPTNYLIFAILGICSISFADERSGDADVHPFFTKNFQISVGAFFPNFDTDIKLNGSGGRVGTLINMEDLLGLDDTMATPIVDVAWRITDKHRLGFSYFNLARDGTRSLSKSINFDDQTYAAGITTKSTLDVSVYRLDYDYSFINEANTEFGIGLAVDLMPVEASI